MEYVARVPTPRAGGSQQAPMPLSLGASLVALRASSRQVSSLDFPKRPSLSFARCILSTAAAQIDGIPRSCLNERSSGIHYIHWHTDTNHHSHSRSSPHSTVIFAATKHHVEYLAALLKAYDFATSYVYGSLDQTARKMQIQDFRTGLTNILVVTDVAARGLDIPVLANVVNYDFPPQPKVFVHRVGRTARAGKTGWAYSLVTSNDMPYLLDLQLFLGRLLPHRNSSHLPSFPANNRLFTLNL